MVNVIAIGTIMNDGKITGYTLKDGTGKEMSIKSEAIIDAIRKNAINISNLYITNNGQLVMKDTNLNNNSETESIQPETDLVEQKTETGTVEKSNITPNNNLDNSKIERIKYLVNYLNKATKVYEQGTDQLISNFEYDKLYDELVQLEQETGIIMNNSPTVSVGYEVVSALPKKQHSTPILGLAKTKERSELQSFLNGRDGVLSWKLDGLTIVVTYENGKLTEAVTRGNGEVGEVVTANVKQFINIPRHIEFKNRLVLRGEAVISYSDFNKINDNIQLEDEKYQNPRNLCSGSVRQLDSAITASRNVQWIVFGVEEADGVNLPNEFDRQFAWLKLQGFDVVEHKVVNPDNLLNAIEEFSSKVETYDIPTDGLVLAFRDRAYGKSLGRTAKSPRHSIAFKWQDETAITALEDIEWSPSRNGLITPVAIFKPVFIEGSTIGRASLHNVSIFHGLELGYGDSVEVYKANMIIPQISDNFDRTATCEIPDTCPCCGYETEIHEEPKSGVLTLWCMNPDCSAKGNRLFEHFVSRDAMNIDGVSKATIQTLIAEGLLTDLPSIFNLDRYEFEITSLEGFGDKSYENMINAINNARNIKLSNLIYALGIPNIGLATAKLICKHFNYNMEQTVCANYAQLIEIEGIGDVIAQSFVEYFSDDDNRQQFVKLIKEVHLIKEEISTDTSMAGVTICVTGDVYIFPNRRVVKDIVESMGGKLTGSVSRSTTYLVTNDTDSGSRKNKAAQEYGIPILTEQEFIDKFNIQI